MGVGEWIPLKLDTPALAGGTLGALFNQDMGELLVRTRQAADAVGATPMDRPRWITTHPVTREAYVTLTNNSSRGSRRPLPRHQAPRPERRQPARQQRLRPDRALARKSNDPASLSFEWDIFVLAGNPRCIRAPTCAAARPTSPPRTPSATPTAWLSTSAACCGSRPTAHSNTGAAGQGNNQMLVANTGSKEIHRFMTGPVGCEVTGLTLDAGPEVSVHQHPAPGRRPGA